MEYVTENTMEAQSKIFTSRASRFLVVFCDKNRCRIAGREYFFASDGCQVGCQNWKKESKVRRLGHDLNLKESCRAWTRTMDPLINSQKFKGLQVQPNRTVLVQIAPTVSTSYHSSPVFGCQLGCQISYSDPLKIRKSKNTAKETQQ